MRFIFKHSAGHDGQVELHKTGDEIEVGGETVDRAEIEEETVIDTARLDESVLDEKIIQSLILSDDPMEEKLPGWRDELVAEIATAREKAQELKAARSIEAEVRTYAKWLDDYGLDFLVSLIPEVGDAASSIGSSVFMWVESARAGRKNPLAYVKIAGLEAADFFVGAVPILGDIADYFFKANKWIAKDFTKHRMRLEKEVTEAVEATGLSQAQADEIIAQIEAPGDKLERLGDVIGKEIEKASQAAKLSH